MTIDPRETPSRKMHSYLLGAIVPRPIAFASTVDKDGRVNLSPFSFFNCFGSRPPILVFSPSRRARDGSTKNTLDNVHEVPEVVINIVSYDFVEKASLASCEYPKGVNEFLKAGLTEVRSQRVRPPRVGESKISMECKVNQVIELGTEGGAGNLVVCEILLMHINDSVLDAEGRIDPWKLDAVARMGADYYCRAQGENIFAVPKPNEKLGMGIDQLPLVIRNSRVLTGNDLGKLGNAEAPPSPDAVREFATGDEIRSAKKEGVDAVHRLAHRLLSEGRTDDAWKALLS